MNDLHASIQADLLALFRVIDLLQKSEKLSFLKQLMDELKEGMVKNASGFDILCYGYYKAKDYKEAIRYGELALGCASTAEASSIRYNLGKCYLNGNEPIKAKNAFNLISRLQPEKTDIKLDLAAAMYACNQKEEACEVLLGLEKESGRLDEKTNLSVQFNLGSHFIRRGNFKKGMELLGLGRKLRIWGTYSNEFPIPMWDGKAYPGKSVLIAGEGGIGDEIINARFFRHIKDLGMKPSFASCQGLSTVLSRMPFDKTQNYTKFSSNIQDIEDYDFWAPAMNLPSIIGLEADELWNGPYLTPSDEYNLKWKSRLTGTFKVGLRWSGNPLYEQDLHRSVSLGKIHEILPEGWTKYSIQKENTEVLSEFPDVISLESELQTFEDAVACINNLDVVITSCTSVAHAAAALGKRVFILVPIMDYYVWGEGKSTTSWYGDNVTLIRQTVPKSWDSAYATLKEKLEEFQPVS